MIDASIFSYPSVHLLFQMLGNIGEWCKQQSPVQPEFSSAIGSVLVILMLALKWVCLEREGFRQLPSANRHRPKDLQPVASVSVVSGG